MDGLDHLATGSRPRKVLVVISDGGDNASDATLDAVLARARASNAAIYTIGIFDRRRHRQESGRAQVAGEHDRRRAISAAIARRAADAPARRIAREIRGGYTIGYVPPARDGAYHRIKVEIDSPARKLNIRTRPGYFAAARASQP